MATMQAHLIFWFISAVSGASLPLCENVMNCTRLATSVADIITVRQSAGCCFHQDCEQAPISHECQRSIFDQAHTCLQLDPTIPRIGCMQQAMENVTQNGKCSNEEGCEGLRALSGILITAITSVCPVPASGWLWTRCTRASVRALEGDGALEEDREGMARCASVGHSYSAGIVESGGRSSWRACGAWCRPHPTCLYWSFDFVRNRCFLHNSAAPETSYYDSDEISGSYTCP